MGNSYGGYLHTKMSNKSLNDSDYVRSIKINNYANVYKYIYNNFVEFKLFILIHPEYEIKSSDLINVNKYITDEYDLINFMNIKHNQFNMMFENIKLNFKIKNLETIFLKLNISDECKLRLCKFMFVNSINLKIFNNLLIKNSVDLIEEKIINIILPESLSDDQLIVIYIFAKEHNYIKLSKNAIKELAFCCESEFIRKLT